MSSIYNTMQTAVSGMQAQATKLSTVGDNIANSSTTGYKDSNTQFETLLGDDATNTYTSGGVQSTIRYNVTGQGTLTTTSSSTDLAVNGDGYFVVKTSAGADVLTRAGNFVENASGQLVNAAGFTLMGYNLKDGSYNAATGSGALQTITIPTALSATPSSTGTLSVNLPSTATAVAGASTPASNSASATYTEKEQLTAYDDLGKPVSLDVYMTRTGSTTWQVATYATSAAASGGGFPYSSGPLNNTTLTFDGTTGALASGSPTSISVPVPGGNTVSIDMSSTTQLATGFTVTTASLDGSAPSTVSSVTVGNDGTLSAVYGSGATMPFYKIPLASVTSPDNMTALAGNVYAPNSDSGSMTLGTANTGGFGKIDSDTLEDSTVDLATQLTDMIIAQRAYEANSKVLTTGSDMLSTIIQAIHN